MASMREIKRRRGSIQSTQQITKAMKLVATVKLQKARQRAENSKPYFQYMYKTVTSMLAKAGNVEHPYLQGGKSDKVGIVVITSNRGLAGGYNNNLFKSINYNDGDIILPIGKKVAEYFSKREVTFFTTEYQIAADVSISDCNAIGQALTEAFEKGEFTSIDIYYTGFVNIISQVPTSKKILPIAPVEDAPQKKALIEYDPSPAAVYGKIVPHYISGIVWGAVCESIASELSARRMAMENATDNAGEIIENLSLTYNRARQAAITQEITEIVAGSQNG